MSALLDTVIDVIDRKVNPLLAADGGAVEVVEVREDEGVVLVRYVGRCAGCPALALTHKKVVTTTLLAADRTIRRVEYTLLEPDD